MQSVFDLSLLQRVSDLTHIIKISHDEEYVHGALLQMYIYCGPFGV